MQITPSSRRTFIRTLTQGVVALPFVSAIAGAAQMSGHPAFPKPGESPEKVGGKQVPTPPLEAESEKSSGEPSAYLPMDKRVGFAVVGLGKLAIEEILPALRQSHGCKLSALVSGDRNKALKIARQYDLPDTHVYSYENFEAIKNNPDVQVIYIVLPNSMHKEFTLRSASIGKHVLCEKPMAMNAAEARIMIDACKSAKVKLMIAYRQQYEPNNRFIQSLIAEKTFGKTKIFEANNSQNQAGQKGGTQQWRHVRAMAGGGALPDIGLYCLNAVRFLTGEEPSEVSAQTYSTPGDPRFKEIEETVAFTLRFPSGLIALCTSSYGAHETKRYRFTSENGWFGMEPSFAYRGLKTEISYALGTAYEHHESPSIAEKNQFALEMDHMAECVLKNKTPLTPGEEGLKDHVIMDAIYASAAKGGIPVRL